MPFIRILTTAGNPAEVKERIAERIRQEAIRIYKPPPGTTVVIFDEYEEDNYSDPDETYMVPVGARKTI